MGPAAGLAGGLVALALFCFGVSLAVATRSLPPNALVGIRTRATRASAEAWYVGHRAARPALRLGGLVALVGMAVVLITGASDPDRVLPVGLASYGVVLVVLLAAAFLADRAARRVARER